MRRSVLTGVAVLCACTNRTDRAEQQYEMVKRAGASAAEICAKGRAVAEDYLQAGDEAAYQAKRLQMAIECQSAELDEAAGIVRGPDGNMIQADNMDLPIDDVSARSIPKATPQDGPGDPCYSAGQDC